MRRDKELAIELRKKRLSYRAIQQQLGVPLSTIAGWFKGLPWSVEIKNRLIQETSFSSPAKLVAIARANKERWVTIRKTYRQKGAEEFTEKKNSLLFCAGVMLYWGEGDKSPNNSQIKLTNSDPNLIKIFYDFLASELGIPEQKITASLLLYPDLIDDVQKNFWSRAIGLPKDRFQKSIYIHGRQPTRRLSYGVCNIRVNSRELKDKMMEWISLYQRGLR